MCDMRRDKRCRASKYFGRRCGILHPLFCDHAAVIRRNNGDRKELIRQEQEKKLLGIGS